MAIERRLTELAGPVGGKLHTARSRNDQVATDMALFTRDARAATAAAIDGADARRWSTPPSATSTGRCPATRTCSAPSRSTSATTCSPTSGCSRATASASRSSRRAAGALPLGAGALAGVELRHRPRLVAARARLRRGRAELDRRRLQPRLRARLPRRRGDLRDPPLAPRRRARAVVERGVRLRASCPTPGRRARRSCRRRRTPTRPSCCAPRRRAIVGHLVALHGVMHALPLTYNKDLQEDKEHLFDAVDTLELCLAAARGMIEARSLRPRADGRRGRPTS